MLLIKGTVAGKHLTNTICGCALFQLVREQRSLHLHAVTWQSISNCTCAATQTRRLHRCRPGSLHSSPTAASDRAVCTIQAALCQASLASPGPPAAGQVQTRLGKDRRDLHARRNAQVQTLGGRPTRLTLDQTDTWRGPRPAAGSLCSKGEGARSRLLWPEEPPLQLVVV